MQCRPVQQLTPAEQAVSSYPPCRVQKSTLPARRRPPRQRRKESKRGRRMCVLCVIIARRARAPFFLCHSAAASPSRARRKDAGRHANKRPTPASTTRRLVFCAMSAARPPAGVVGRVLSPSSVHLVFVLFVIRPPGASAQPSPSDHGATPGGCRRRSFACAVAHLDGDQSLGAGGPSKGKGGAGRGRIPSR